jgi:hypothetical protein
MDHLKYMDARFGQNKTFSTKVNYNVSSSKPQKGLRELSVHLPEWTRKVDQFNYNL